MFMIGRRDTLGCGRHTQQKRRMVTTGTRTRLAKEPKEDQAGVGVTVGGSLPADGRDMRATTATADTAGAEGAQEAPEESQQEQDKAQRARLYWSKQKKKRRLLNKPGWPA